MACSGNLPNPVRQFKKIRMLFLSSHEWQSTLRASQSRTYSIHPLSPPPSPIATREPPPAPVHQRHQPCQHSLHSRIRPILPPAPLKLLSLHVQQARWQNIEDVIGSLLLIENIDGAVDLERVDWAFWSGKARKSEYRLGNGGEMSVKRVRDRVH